MRLPFFSAPLLGAAILTGLLVQAPWAGTETASPKTSADARWPLHARN